MNYSVAFHPEAEKEFAALDGSVRALVLKQIKKLQSNPYLGDLLGNKSGIDLTGFRKMYAVRKRIRIVYEIDEAVVRVYIIAIGERENDAVYRQAKERR